MLVIAPHPDDETLGCGGALLKHKAKGDEVHWLIVTEMREDLGFAPEKQQQRQAEIEAAAKAYGFAQTHHLGWPVMQLDLVPMSDLVTSIAQVVQEIGATTLYLPYRGDAHSDHAYVFDAAVACSKSFRYPSVKRVRVYETLSETNFGLNTQDSGFQPNLFIDISDHLEGKIDIMRIFASEMAPHPFPRSEVSIRALASLRGSQVACMAAESFMQLKDIQ
ncbi:PIG-L deacetylase family protein [Thiomicrorhabdus xiamenensis]|uniref:PIG-L deacetylase family protein n=1 Tax=Thiomicrorhabdus xiamenensis TaxID=2739063 RepID=UPI001EEB5227|nr:PIG-L deacetylase family protein [Thiomicrorhabdus xiamenensis]